MKKFILSAFIASSLITGPGMLVTSTGAFAQRGCDAGAPEAWFRPGGFCDALKSGGSLSGPVFGVCTEFEEIEPVVFNNFQKGERVHVAETCYYECDYGPSLTAVAYQPGDRLRLAQSCDEE
jgi:hypothetical protein